MVRRSSKRPLWQAISGEGQLSASVPDWFGDDRWAWSGACVEFTLDPALQPGSYRLTVDIDSLYVVRPQCLLAAAENAHTNIRLYHTFGSHYEADIAVTTVIDRLCFAPDDLPHWSNRDLKWSNLTLDRLSKFDFYRSALGFLWHILRHDRRLLGRFIEKAWGYLKAGQAPPSIHRGHSPSRKPSRDVSRDLSKGLSDSLSKGLSWGLTKEEYVHLTRPRQDAQPRQDAKARQDSKAWTPSEAFPGFNRLVVPEVDGGEKSADAADPWLVPDIDAFKPSPLLGSRLMDLATREADPIAFVTFDDVLCDASGAVSAPFFRPDWSPTYLSAWNYIGAAYAIRASKLRHLCGHLGATDPLSLPQNVLSVLAPGEVTHLPQLLGAWQVQSADEDPRHRLWKPRPEPVKSNLSTSPSICILIPTRNRVALLKACLESIERGTDYPNYHLLVIDNGSDEEDTLLFLKHGQSEGRFSVLRDDGPFNYSALNNKAAAQCDHDYLLLLNNDTTVCHDDWLAQMVLQAQQPGVGAVGAKLTYPNGCIQHAGLVMSLGSSVAGHLFKQAPGDDRGYFGSLALPREVSALTGACLLIKRELYQQLGGLDEEHLAVTYNDVDLSLKIREAGYRLIWTPWAELIHHESLSRGRSDVGEEALRAAREVDIMRRRWGLDLRRDPYFSQRLSRDHFTPTPKLTAS